MSQKRLKNGCHTLASSPCTAYNRNMPAKHPQIITHHLIWTLYGHWLANDPRGSGSIELREQKFAPLGPVHHGRQPEQLQPTRDELREFHQHAEPLLSFPRFRINETKRQAFGETFAEVIASENYTVWACAILSNHAHLLIRRHRDDALAMWHKFPDATRLRLRELDDIDANHPVWSDRPYKVFLLSPDDVRRCIAYVQGNPKKEGLPPQDFAFVKPYDNWPYHQRG